MNLLVTHDERALAPAAGVDVFAVLAHAMQAKRLERRTGVWVVAIWALFALVDLLVVNAPFVCKKKGERPGMAFYECAFELPSYFFLSDALECELDMSFWVFNYTCMSLLLWLAGSSSRRTRSVYEASGQTPGHSARFLFTVIGPKYLLASYWATAFVGIWRNPAHWVAVAFPLLLAIPVWVHRRTIERMMRDQFHTDTFGQWHPEGLKGPAWLQDVGEAIRKEQDSKIVLYDVDQGFTGLGRAASESMPLVTDLKPKPGVVPEPLISADVLALVRDELEELRKDTGLRPQVDRLGEVRIDDLVYLPAKPPRALVDHGPEATEKHLREAVEEGGEARRYYLRARISAWEQQVAVTALVRVCVQGKSLTLEVFLYVMDPLRPEFELVDAIADQGPDLPASSVVRALLTAPASGLAALFSLASSVEDMRVSVRRRLDRRNGWDTPSQGASGSVRELAATYKESPILEMDVNRYLAALLERITNGAIRTLREKGYDTGQLEQQVINVSQGGIFIGAMSGGAVAAGQGARARNVGARRTVGARRRAGARV
ncbi:hypothetical protein [Streptomyces sp. NPDC016626]|uniref:hypothetical protein n=1 Tax=Streptomyces sp. NPDC016626 TaxID=3364968 RepID=UPI0037015B0F